MSEIKNDDVLVFNTEQQTVSTQEVKTFNLVPPDHKSMTTVLPEFDFSNPPVNPNEFASTLVETAKKLKTLGLSANQCGFSYRVFVMGTDDNYIACYNPKIISSEGESHLSEGCSTFPLLEFKITRPKSVTVEYQDFVGESHTKTFTGLTARIFQHEFDHMNGKLYMDRVKPLALKSGIKKLEKIRRNFFNPKIMKKMNDKLAGNKKV